MQTAPASNRATSMPGIDTWPWGRILLWLVVGAIFAFLVAPSLLVVPMALTPLDILEFPPSGISLHSFADFFSSPAWLDATLTSLKVALIAISVSAVMGTLAAIALHRATFRGRSLVIGAILLPIATPLVVLGLGYLNFFARLHLVATPLGIGLAHAVLALPYVYLVVASSLNGLNPALVRAARSLGGGPIAVFRHVYLPVILPGLLGGMLLAFTLSFDEVVIAYFLQGPDATTLPVKIFIDLQYSLTPVIAAVSTLLLMFTTLLLAVQMVLMLRRSRISLLPGGMKVTE